MAIFNVTNVAQGEIIPVRDEFTATAGQRVFILSVDTTGKFVDVFLNGIRNTAFSTVTTTLTLDVGVPMGTDVVVITQ